MAPKPTAAATVSLTSTYRSWSGPAQSMALAIDAAVEAALSTDLEGFDRAAAELSQADREQVRLGLGHVSRELFERAHPDGLDSDDAERALQSCASAAIAWFRPFDRNSLVVALTAALGVGETEDAAGLDETSVLRHGLLLIADQLRTSGLRLEPLLDSALRELKRAQTIEMP